jgi:hypothetical protein
VSKLKNLPQSPLSLTPSTLSVLKQKWFCLKTQHKSLTIKEINQENPENHFNHGIFSDDAFFVYAAIEPLRTLR